MFDADTFDQRYRRDLSSEERDEITGEENTEESWECLVIPQEITGENVNVSLTDNLS